MANGKGGGFFAGFLIGAVAGAATAAFLTQDDARERLAEKAREASDAVNGVTSNLQSNVSDLYERGRQVVERARSNIDAAIEEGQMTAQATADELARKAEG